MGFKGLHCEGVDWIEFAFALVHCHGHDSETYISIKGGTCLTADKCHLL
jgi:hypothetical protein